MGFSAFLWTSTNNGRPRLDGVLYNYQNSYSLLTGKFTCPRNGVYMITSTIVTKGGAHTEVLVRVGRRVVTTIVADARGKSSGQFGSGTGAVMSECRQGEEISLEAYGGSNWSFVGGGKTTLTALRVGLI